MGLLSSFQTFALKKLPQIECPRCAATFSPKDVPPSAFSDGKFTCPKCNAPSSVADLVQTANRAAQTGRDASLNPISEVPKPRDTRIEAFRLPDGNLGLLIPKPGKSGGFLAFAVIWLSFCAVVGVPIIGSIFYSHSSGGRPEIIPILFALIFPTVGLGMLYFGLRIRNSIHRILTSATEVICQREFFRSTKRVILPLADIDHVTQEVFYTKNYQPVLGIEIATKTKKFRFGSQLSPEEKAWLVWTLRSEIRRLGNPRVLPLPPHSQPSV